MIQRLINFLRSLFWRWFPNRNRQVTVLRPVQRQSPAEAGNPRRMPRANQRANPAMEAIREIFAPRHAAEEQVVFTRIRRDGVVVEKSEEWFREGNTMKTVSRRSVVVTCSGEVVSPANIKARCSTCGGFDSHIARCSHPECGVALCRLHQRLFVLSSPPVVLCDRHYREAIAAFDTWTAFDQRKPPIRKKA